MKYDLFLLIFVTFSFAYLLINDEDIRLLEFSVY